jgi:Polyketide cyclase / dehydrase and lipid transport
MKSELRIGLFALLATVLLYFGLSSILPASWREETQVVIAAEPAKILPSLSDFRSWKEWTTLTATERTDTMVEIEGEAGKPGHAIVWKSNQNEASLRLVTVLADGVDYEFTSRLGKDGKMEQIGRGSLRVSPDAQGGGTKVTWADESSVGTFVERWFVWFGVLQEKAREFQLASLNKLKQRLEAQPQPASEPPSGVK